jgi:hypothetical protein
MSAMARASIVAAALLVAAATPVFADRPDLRPELRDDGTVVYDGTTYPTLAAWYASDAFRASGARCGTETPQVSFISPNDCDFDRTVVNPEYEDGRTLVIQVVLHAVETTIGTGRLSDEHLRSQIAILNEDFQGTVGTPGEGGANTQIEFVLARFAPDGSPTSGIDRVVSDAYFFDPGSGSSGNPMKSALNWDPTRYLNIYTNDADGLLGYATYPALQAGTAQDGVVLLWASVGRDSPGGPPYNQGRTASHEVGHYLGLHHTFEGGCAGGNTGGDLIADTTPEAQPHFDCDPNAPSGCGTGLSPVRNYMDYSVDACFDHFTAEQANRMRCSIINYRTVNTKPTAAFAYDASGLEVTFEGQGTDDETPDGLLYAWSFGDGTASTEKDPLHAYAEPGVYTVTLEVVDPGSGTGTATQELEVKESAGCCQTGSSGGGAIVLAILVLFVVLRSRTGLLTDAARNRRSPRRATSRASRP